MAKKKQNEQMELLPQFTTAQQKQMAAIARDYNHIQKTRISALAREVELKNRIKDFAKKAKFRRLPDGSIRFTAEGIEIAIVPQDEKVTVKESKKNKQSGD